MESSQNYLFDQPSDYRIRVSGRFDSKLADSLWGMTCEECIVDGVSETVLEGMVTDQAAIIGVLNALYNMGYAVLSVNLVTDADDADLSTTDNNSAYLDGGK